MNPYPQKPYTEWKQQGQGQYNRPFPLLFDDTLTQLGKMNLLMKLFEMLQDNFITMQDYLDEVLRFIESEYDKNEEIFQDLKETVESFNSRLQNAETTADDALRIASTLQNKINATAQRLETIIIESGTSDAETIAARVNAITNESYSLLHARLDADFERFEKRTNDIAVFLSNYGVIGDTEENQTEKIHQAFADNPAATTFIFPLGVIYCNIVLQSSYVELKGQGTSRTILKPFDLTIPVVDFNKKFYVTVKDLEVTAPYEFTGESIVKTRDSRYTKWFNSYIHQTPNESGEFSFSSVCVDIRNDVNTWSGYNSFTNTRFSGGLYGLMTGTGLHSVLHLTDCGAYNCGKFGLYLDGVQIGKGENLEINRCGLLAEKENVYDESQYGGIYVKGSLFKLDGLWCEYNRPKKYGYMPNNVYIAPGSENIEIGVIRNERNNRRTMVELTHDEKNSKKVLPVNDGLGKERVHNLIKNGDFTYWQNTIPKKWGYTAADRTQQGSGYLHHAKSVLLNGLTGSMTSVYQEIINPNDITKYIGRTFTMTAFVKVTKDTANPTVRVGLDVGTGNVTLTTGNGFITSDATGGFIQIVSDITITEEHSRLTFVAYISGTGATLELTGVSVAMSPRVNAHEPSPITEKGGDILGTLLLNGIPFGVTEGKPTTVGVKGEIRIDQNATINQPLFWFCIQSNNLNGWRGVGIVSSE